MKVREVVLQVAVADERTLPRPQDGGRLRFSQRSLHEFVKSQPEQVPVMLAHGVTEAEYAGFVRRWELGPHGRSLLAVCAITREVSVKAGDGVSLGLDFRSRRDETSGDKIITSFTAREVSVGLTSGPAMKSAKVLRVGPAMLIPDAEVTSLQETEDRARSRWAAAGLPWGSSVGVFGGSQPRGA